MQQWNKIIIPICLCHNLGRVRIPDRSKLFWRVRIAKAALLVTQIAMRSIDHLPFRRRWWWTIKNIITNMWTVAASRRRSSYSTSDASLENAVPMKGALLCQSSAIKNRIWCSRRRKRLFDRHTLTHTLTDTHTHLYRPQSSSFSCTHSHSIYVFIYIIVAHCHQLPFFYSLPFDDLCFWWHKKKKTQFDGASIQLCTAHLYLFISNCDQLKNVIK
jgi:hypothetical protein